MNITRQTFSTDGQWNKFQRAKKFFERLIELKNENHLILVDGEHAGNPVIEGWEMGFKEGNGFHCFVGSSHTLNPKTGE